VSRNRAREPSPHIVRNILPVFAACAAILLPHHAAAAGARGAAGLSLTNKELGSMVAPLPGGIRDRILADRGPFLDLVGEVLDGQADLLVLVDKSHPLAAEYAPPDLVSLNDYPLSVSRNDLRLRRAIMPVVLEMEKAARADGVTLLFSSSYRSYDYQVQVYEREVKASGREAADRVVARPGMSQHQLGTVIDFGSITDAFAETRAGRWLHAHAGEYGFSLSFPRGYEEVTGYSWECWHYRYVGRPAARLQKDYFGDVQQYMMEFLHANRSFLEARRAKGP
jgi:zinc D-Ala-D-Ala carboxypeptidase